MSGERMREIRVILGSDDLDAIRTLAREDVPWLLARVEELEAALLPFAEAAGCFASHASSGVIADTRTGALTVGDFRAARAALSPDSEP